MNEAKLKVTTTTTAAPAAPAPLSSGQAAVGGKEEKTVKPTTPAMAPPVTAAPLSLPQLPVAATQAPMPLAVPEDEAAQVLFRFQDLMAKFLDTQRAVMLSYLHGGQNGAVPPPAQPPVQLPVAFMPSANGQNGHVHAAVPSIPETPPAAVAPPVPEPVAPVSQVEAANGTPAAPSQGPTMDREWLVNQLLDLVSKRTGYPKEMLGFDLDLEADLGIDSIKRVEILGGLAEQMGGTDSPIAANIEMEKLTSIKTLRGIIDYLTPILEGAGQGPTAAATPSANGHVETPAKQLEVQRGLVRLADAPMPPAGSALLPSGVVLITDDGRGIAREVMHRLEDFGQKTVLVRSGTTVKDNGDIFTANLTDPQGVNEVVERIRKQHGPVAGLIHLLPLAKPATDDKWQERMRREVKSLYLLARAVGEDMRERGSEGGAVMLAATGLGGHFGFGGEKLADTFFPGHGGVLGFTKCLAYEWPEVLVRAVDVDPARPTEEIAQRLLSELSDPEGPLEIGYLGGRRVTWEPYQAPLEGDPNALPVLDPASVVLVTGGARGITAAIALELAKRFQPTLILAGRSALPDETEAPETAKLESPADIKAVLMARLQREGRPILPAQVEAAYQRLLQDREIRGNLANIKQAGGKVHYYQVDVRNEAALSQLLAEIEQKFGKIDGVLHGAGVIEDKLIKDKTPESFERVFSTKVDSAVTLARCLKPEQLKFCVFFASIASRYGNRGQSDYAAANEILSKMAIYLDQKWPCRVFSVAWGPWASIGMVADLEKHLVARGLKLISPEEGPAFLIDELTHGSKGDTEIIIAGGAENVAQPVKGSRRAGSKEAKAEKVGV